jgi:hypothetical protein
MQFDEFYRSLGCILPATCPAGFDPEIFRIIRWNQVWVYVGKVGLNRFGQVRFADPTMRAETMKQFAEHYVAGITDASPPQTCG